MKRSSSFGDYDCYVLHHNKRTLLFKVDFIGIQFQIRPATAKATANIKLISFLKFIVGCLLSNTGE